MRIVRRRFRSEQLIGRIKDHRSSYLQVENIVRHSRFSKCKWRFSFRACAQSEQTMAVYALVGFSRVLVVRFLVRLGDLEQNRFAAKRDAHNVGNIAERESALLRREGKMIASTHQADQDDVSLQQCLTLTEASTRTQMERSKRNT